MGFRSAVLALLAVLSAVPSLTAVSFESTGSTVMLNAVPYYVPATSVAKLRIHGEKLQQCASVAGLVPLTVVHTTSLTLSQTDLTGIIANYTTADDVFQSAFLEAVYVEYVGSIAPTSHSPFVPTISSNLVGTSMLQDDRDSKLPPGPYFLSAGGSVYQAWRLYEDFTGAFTQPLIPKSDGTYAALPASVPGIASPAVGVPSRLYYRATPEKPLAGIRTGIKDIFDIAGVKTSDGNRAWYGLYPPANKTAIVVQRLIDAGAVLVGKVKTSQFANGETATADWVDYHEPFNPRGDGYQDTQTSSAGSGAAIAAYPWLDLTLGSDTGGSIRGPAAVQGIFGNRPTHGIAPLTGAMPLAPELDTAGLLCRDSILWSAAAKVLYPELIFYTQYPQKVQVIGFPTTNNTESNGLILAFLNKIQAFLSVTATKLDYDAVWTASKPASAPASLQDLLYLTYPTLIGKEETKNVRDPFYAAYAAAHDGRRPFIDPVPLVRWAYADSVPDSALTDAQNNKTIFMNWWNSKVLFSNATTCSDSLVLYVGSTADRQVYRNKYLSPPVIPAGFDPSSIAPFSEVPDFVIPLGQASYFSNITQHPELLPVTVDVMAAKGCDGLLYNFINDLVTAGIVIPSSAGGTLTGGDVLLRRGG